MNRPAVFTVVSAAIAAFVLVTPTPAGAQTAPIGRDFGHHVAECAQTAGMGGSHNPGMHQGFSNWDGLPC